MPEARPPMDAPPMKTCGMLVWPVIAPSSARTAAPSAGSRPGTHSPLVAELDDRDLGALRGEERLGLGAEGGQRVRVDDDGAAPDVSFDASAHGGPVVGAGLERRLEAVERLQDGDELAGRLQQVLGPRRGRREDGGRGEAEERRATGDGALRRRCQRRDDGEAADEEKRAHRAAKGCEHKQ